VTFKHRFKFFFGRCTQPCKKNVNVIVIFLEFTLTPPPKKKVEKVFIYTYMAPCKYFWPDQDKWTSFWNRNCYEMYPMFCVFLGFVFENHEQMHIFHNWEVDIKYYTTKTNLFWSQLSTITTSSKTHGKFINLTFFTLNYFYK
jgi:hypothetical protein